MTHEDFLRDVAWLLVHTMTVGLPADRVRGYLRGHGISVPDLGEPQMSQWMTRIEQLEQHCAELQGALAPFVESPSIREQAAAAANPCEAMMLPLQPASTILRAVRALSSSWTKGPMNGT